ncbi:MULTISPECIES: hypothetical protein [unclassified Frigoribacterium]|uniref:hypothetical protein n=1 Tax=unclassified Frigoribacterium TaxID=2627005 RepID=UPI0006FB8732|nr:MULTISPECIES: hypothetical protein [unclassified Frigoribacterium]KQO81082.1 hypothetical protein ASF17_13235 [Frigoribacterium sp. Leaf263]KQR62934.1 hypothetical protein ASF89_13505 [Frigoribacterium sp. Leaf172]
MTSTYTSDPATEPIRIVGYRKPRARPYDEVVERRRRNAQEARNRPEVDPRLRYMDFLVVRQDERTG